MNCIVLAWLQWLHLASNFTSLYKLVGIDQFRKFAPEVHLAEDSGALGWSAGALREQTLHVHLASVITESWQTSLYDRHCRFSILSPFFIWHGDIRTRRTWVHDMVVYDIGTKIQGVLLPKPGKRKTATVKSPAPFCRTEEAAHSRKRCCSHLLQQTCWLGRTNKVLALRKNSYVDTGPWNQIE